MREKMMNFNNKTELRKYLPGDLLPKVTILLQMIGVDSMKRLSEWAVFGSSRAVTHIGAFLGHNKVARALRWLL